MRILDWINRKFGNPTYEQDPECLSEGVIKHEFLGKCCFATEGRDEPGLGAQHMNLSYWISRPKGWGLEILIGGSPKGLVKDSEIDAIEIYKRISTIQEQVKLLNPIATDLFFIDCREKNPKVVFMNPDDGAYSNPPSYIAMLNSDYDVTEVVKDWD